MGQLISGLNLRSGDTFVPELGFDIQNATPSSQELQLYNKFYSALIKPGPTLLSLLESYVPASELIRDAIMKPTPENEAKAWDAVSPTVDALRDVYDYSIDLAQYLPKLLSVLCEGDVNKNLEKNQGLAKLFAELLDFVFEFDSLKMRSPTLQNDFSYYRRMLQRGRFSDSRSRQSVSDLRSEMIEDEQANNISLFIAYPTPMLKCVIDTITDFVSQQQLQKSVGGCLAALWSNCYTNVSKKKNQNAFTSAFCMKVMVVSIILYDHIDPNGAFYKHSPINIKHSVKIIQTNNNLNASKELNASSLLSALRYNSKHLNDDTTPKNLRNLVLAT